MLNLDKVDPSNLLSYPAFEDNFFICVRWSGFINISTETSSRVGSYIDIYAAKRNARNAMAAMIVGVKYPTSV